MDCPACGESTVAFAVPEDIQPELPEDAETAAICPRCLTLVPLDPGCRAPAPEAADFGRIIESFPGGEAGAAMAVAVGLLVDSLALNRDAVRRLFDVVSDAGADPWLVLERLAAAGSVQPDADLARLRQQLAQLWR